MTSSALAGHPFGTVITEETLKQTFVPLTQWEDKYRQLILLGKQLPTLSDSEITGEGDRRLREPRLAWV